MNILINTVYANVNSTDQGSPYSLVIMLIIFAIIFYFMIFRPQQKRNKRHKALLNSLTKGDEVLTNGGLVGRIIKVVDIDYVLMIINEKNNHLNNEVLVKRDCITAILPKGTIQSLQN